MVVAITRSGYIKRLPVTTYREQRRGGIGVMGMDLKDDDYIEHLVVASTHDYLLFFTSVGKVYRLKVHELPLGLRQSKGRALVNLLPFAQGETVRALIATRDFEEAEYLVLATRKGVVKKTRFAEYNTPLKADGIIAIKPARGRRARRRPPLDGDDDILMVSRKGQAIRFHEKQARPMGRATEGVMGMRLREGDEVIVVSIARNDDDLLVVTENGYGKRTRIDEYPVKGRGWHGREDGAAHRGARPARRRARRARRLPGDADLERRHGDQDAGRGREAARPLDPGRDRHAPARRRAGLDPRERRRAGRRERRPTVAEANRGDERRPPAEATLEPVDESRPTDERRTTRRRRGLAAEALGRLLGASVLT